MTLTRTNKFTQALAVVNKDRILVCLTIATTIFYSSQDISYLYKFLALIGWYLAITLKLFQNQVKIKFYYWILIVIVYQVCLSYWFEPL